jgi:Flp pilus assembly pilin Flp
MLTKLTDISRTFHNDEDGLEAVQVVMIVAIAAMVLVAMGKFGNDIIKWAKTVFTTDLQNGAKGITY